MPDVDTGQTCDSHADCGSLAFACVEKVCTCNPTWGYIGEDCSSPTIVTKCTLALAITLFFLSLLVFFCAISMLHAYGSLSILFDGFRKCRVSSSNSQKKIYIAEEYSHVRRKQHQPRKIQRKDICVYSVFVYSCTSIVWWSGYTLDLSIFPSMPFVTKWQPHVLILLLFSFTLTQACLGMAWMEACVKCGAVRQLSKLAFHFKRIEAGIILVVLFETLGLGATYLVNGIKSSADVYIFVSVILFTFSPQFCILFGWLLSKQMLSLEGGHEITKIEGQRIRSTSKMMIWLYTSIIFTTVASSLFMYSANWWFVTILLILMLHISLLSYQLAVLNYSDTQAYVFRFSVAHLLRSPTEATVPGFAGRTRTSAAIRPQNTTTVLRIKPCSPLPK